MANNGYFDCFKDKMAAATGLGSTIGSNQDRIAAILQEDAVDPVVPTEQERDAASEKAQEEYFATRNDTAP